MTRRSSSFYNLICQNYLPTTIQLFTTACTTQGFSVNCITPCQFLVVTYGFGIRSNSSIKVTTTTQCRNSSKWAIKSLLVFTRTGAQGLGAILKTVTISIFASHKVFKANTFVTVSQFGPQLKEFQSNNSRTLVFAEAFLGRI